MVVTAKVVLTVESVHEMYMSGTDQVKATEQYFPVVVFTSMLYKLAVLFEFTR